MAAIADFRSDTLTQPHAAMRAAMAQAAFNTQGLTAVVRRTGGAPAQILDEAAMRDLTNLLTVTERLVVRRERERDGDGA